MNRVKEDVGIVRNLADYTIRHHFPHIDKMNKSDKLSSEADQEGSSLGNLSSNKYAGNTSIILFTWLLFTSLPFLAFTLL